MNFLKRHILFLLLVAASCKPDAKDQGSGDWCGHQPRSFEGFREVQTPVSWFKVYEVPGGVYAIYEPYHFQETVSYLIVGSERALLFDTAMGFDSIQQVVKSITQLPVVVMNSHSHSDHIGGNADFETIYGADTDYTRRRSRGLSHDSVRGDVMPYAMCLDKLKSSDTASYAIRPYDIDQFLHDGDTISLGDRTLEVMHVPGHTPDCISILDRKLGYLWTGDMYYPATIWLFAPATNLADYSKSLDRYAELAPSLKYVFPAHNGFAIDPEVLPRLRDAWQKVVRGEIKGQSKDDYPEGKDAVEFPFDGFSFLVRRNLLPNQQ